MALSTTGTMVLTAVLAAGVAGGTVLVLGPGPGPAPEAAPGAELEGRLADLDARLEDQARTLAALRGRFEEMQIATPPAADPGAKPVPVARDSAGVTAVTGPDRSTDEAAPAPSFEVDGDSAALEAAVAAVLEKREEAEREERRRRIEERMQERLDRVAQEIGLSEEQKTLVGEVMRDNFMRTREIIEQARSLDDAAAMEAAREEIRQLRETNEVRLESALSAEQFQVVSRLVNGGDRTRSGRGGERNGFRRPNNPAPRGQ